MVLSLSTDRAMTAGRQRNRGTGGSRPHPVLSAPNPDRQPPDLEPASGSLSVWSVMAQRADVTPAFLSPFHTETSLFPDGPVHLLLPVSTSLSFS